MKRTEVHDLMLVDLARSGLDEAVKRIYYSPLLRSETKELTGKSLAAYRITYPLSSGKKSDFSRLRFLENKGPFGAELSLRYWQPKDSGVHVYFSRLMKWGPILNDPTIPLIVTEGEKKSDCACLHEMPTIGLGGVWSFRSKKNHQRLVPEFEEFIWGGREVWICYDSDVMCKPEVLAAMHALAKELLKNGATPKFIVLPEQDNQKVGLDDFLVEHGADKFLSLPQEGFELAQELYELNEEIAFIWKPAGVYIIKTGEIVKRDTLTSLIYSNRQMVTVQANGDEKLTNAAGEWLKWPQRRTHNSLTYAPGEPQVTIDNKINTWAPWPYEPAKGNIKPWVQLLDFIFSGYSEERKWFEQWAAYPIQHPGTKLYSAVLFFSLTHGVGKSLTGLTLARIYGDNASEIGEEDLHAGFNFWSEKKQFIVADEVTSGDRRKDTQRLKRMITREELLINTKYQPQYKLPDLVNYFLTANPPDALFIENDDRRFFIHEILGRPLSDDFYKRYDKWYRSDKGIQALFYYLQNEIDCTGFNPKGHAMYTEAKSDMTMLSASDLDLWVYQLKENPEGVLLKRIDLFSSHELVEIYDPDGTKKTAVIAMSKSLRRAGFRQLCRMRIGKKLQRLWAVRNIKKWEKSTPEEQLAHLSKKDRVRVIENKRRKV